MNDPYLLYNIARFANTNILLNLIRASRQFHKLVAENPSVKNDLMDCYAKDGYITLATGVTMRHGKFCFNNRIEYWRAGKLHRDGDLAAVIYNNVRMEWYQNGLLHRDGDRPAVIDNKEQCWYNHGVLHRDGDLPAVIDGGLQEWYTHGERHRDGDLPAVILGNGGQDLKWYKHGKLHRDGGRPAIIRPWGFKMWYVNGVRIE